MNPTTTRFATLFGSASLLTLTNVFAAQAQTAPAQTAEASSETAPEQVLITGSLIHGAAAVGVPVVALSQQYFIDTGMINVNSLLSKVPGITINQFEQATTNGNITRPTSLTVHRLSGSRILLMVDGMRYPLDGPSAGTVDANILPQLAIDRVDVLKDGASATYGSDAIASVINQVMKRGYDGAETLLSIGQSASGLGGGDLTYVASQLFGRTWNGGDITVTYEVSGSEALTTSDNRLRRQFTFDYTPWGLDNRTPVNDANPGIVSTGKPNATIGTGCTNCFSIPTGQNGVGLTWARLLTSPGVSNERNPYEFGPLTSPTQTNAATITFDQTIIPGISLFIDALYHNRRFAFTPSPASLGKDAVQTFTVPTTNPYYPAGAPSNLQVSVNLAYGDPERETGSTVGKRIAGGFNIDLPFAWNLRLFTSYSELEPTGLQSNIINLNAANAALGNTIPAQVQTTTTPPIASWTKPANIPYLNVFCDQMAFTCNDPLTLEFMAGIRHFDITKPVRESGANFDGPVFDLPGGKLRAAVGTEITAFNYRELVENSFTTVSPGNINQVKSSFTRTVYSAYAQVNIPVFGENFKLPLVENLNLEGSYRYDHYSDFGNVDSPKAALNWTLRAGFTAKFDWGKSFRAPFVGELEPSSSIVHGANSAAGGTNNTPACGTVGGTPVPGSAAAILNPTCSAALQFQGGITFSGAPIPGIRPGDGLPSTLSPETATNRSFGLEFAPDYSFLKGLYIEVTDWNVDITNFLSSGVGAGNGELLNSPLYKFTVVTKADPNFAKYVQILLANVSSNVPLSAVNNITWISDGGFINSGWYKGSGVDYQASYDVNLGDYGDFNLTTSGTYYTKEQSQVLPGGVISDTINFTGVNNGTTFPVWISRSGLGWSDGGFAVNAFWNHTSHYFTNQSLPPAQFLTKFPISSDLVPAFDTLDLVFRYSTGDQPAYDYFRNISITLNVNDVFDKVAPFSYAISGGGQAASAFINNSRETYIGRFVMLSIDKRW